MAEIDGDENNNSLNGTSGSDTIRGLAGNDTIDGNSGDDTVLGGDGDDVITGGAGDDIIIGGRGNDTLSAGNSSPSDTFVIRDGDGSDVITDFDPGEPDIVAFHMAELRTYQDVLDRMNSDGSDTIINFDNGAVLRFENVSPGSFSSGNFTYNTGPICFHAGTLIATLDGVCRIEDLRIGDLVETADKGAQPIRHIVEQWLHFLGEAVKNKPILIKANALALGSPNRDLILSPQHRVLVKDVEAGEHVLVAACKLVGRKGVRAMHGRTKVNYFNLVFERHEIVFANACASESVLVTPYSLDAIGLTVFEDVLDCDMLPARRIMRTDPISQARVLN